MLLRAALFGAAFGALFPGIAYFLRSQPEALFAIICSAPLVLAGHSYVLAWFQDLESLQERKTILDIMSEGLIIQDDAGRVLSFNPAALSILGLTEDQLLGLKPRDPRWQILREDGTLALPEEHPARVALQRNEPIRNVTVGLKLPDQQSRWIKINAIPVVSANGRHVVVTFSDITERHLLTIDMRGIFNHSKDLICIVDLAGRFKRVSPSFMRTLGYSENELLEKNFDLLIHPQDLNKAQEAIKELAQGGAVSDLETRWKTSNGEYRRISWACEPRLQSGLIYASGRDVTEQRIEEGRRNEIYNALNRSAIIAFTDVEGQITEANDNFCRISGYSREEIIGQNHRIVNSGKQSKAFFANLWNTIKEGKTWTGDIENRAKNGIHYNVRTVVAPLMNLEGKIERFMAIRFDVTQEKALERQLQEAQVIAQLGSWRYDLKTDQRAWSSQSYKIFEMEESQSSESLTKYLQSIMLPEDWQQYTRYFEKAKTRGEDFEMHYRICVGPEKRVKYLREVGKVQRDSHGRPSHLTGTVQDVTELALKELELKKLIDLNSAIMRSARVGIVMIDQKGLVSAFNDEAERILGYAAEEVVGKLTPKSFHDFEEVKAAARDLSREAGTIIPPGFESLTYKARMGHFDERQWSFVKKDGSRVPVWLNVTALRDAGGEIYGFMGMFRDMSEEIRIQQQLEEARLKSIHNSRLASLGEMSAGVAHEINNPLAIIVGSSMLLRKLKDDPEKFNGKVEAIVKASGRIEKIVKGLRKFARSSDGSPHALAPLSEIISESLVLTEPKSKRYAVNVTTELSQDLNVFCDRAEIEQVLINLINNGVDAVKNLSERWVKVQAFSESGSVVLRVVDSGNGIPSEVEQKLFQPFFTTKPVGEGTGLGLSITKGILDQHKASISLNRSLKHTCFEIRFPKYAA